MDEETLVTEIRAIFIDEEEPIRVPVPGKPDSWVDLRPMDSSAKARYQSMPLFAAQDERGGTRVRQRQDEGLMVRMAVYLLQETVVCWHLVGLRKTSTPPLGENTEQARRAEIERLFRDPANGWHQDFSEWLLQECLKINRLSEAEQKN